MPEKNRKDLVEVPEEIRKDLTFVFCGRMEDVLNEILGADNLLRVRTELAARKSREPATPEAAKPAEA